MRAQCKRGLVHHLGPLGDPLCGAELRSPGSRPVVELATAEDCRSCDRILYERGAERRAF